MLLQILLLASSAWATDDSVPNDPLLSIPVPGALVDDRAGAPQGVRQTLPAREIFERTQEVYARFNVPAEPESQDHVDPLQGLMNPELLASRLPFLDPDAQWSRYSRMDGRQLIASQDRDSKQTEDFRVRLADSSNMS